MLSYSCGRWTLSLFLLATLQLHLGCKSGSIDTNGRELGDDTPVAEGAGGSSGVQPAEPGEANPPGGPGTDAEAPGEPGVEPEPPPSHDGASFFDDFDGAAIDDSVWLVATWAEHGGQTGPERCYVEDGYLKMTFINDSKQGYLSSAIQTREEFFYGRWEARLKPSSVPGVLNSMFTIDWDDTSNPNVGGDGTKQEIDIEFLTYSFTGDDGRVHLALHAAGLPSAATNPDVLLGFDPSADFHVWGFEITPEKVEWFVDERVLLSYVYSDNPITIDSPYILKFNVWSMVNWINGPPVPDTKSIYLIDWVRFIPLEQ